MKRTPEEIMELMDKFLDEYETADSEYRDNQDRENWNNKFGERFGQYSDKLKTLNGDDFDILESSRKEYHDQYSDLTDDEYADALEANIKKILNRVWPEATEEEVAAVAEEAVEKTEEEVAAPEETPITEETTITEEVPAESSEETEEETPAESTSEEVTPEETPESEETTEEDPVKSFTAELEEYKANMPKRNKE